MFFVYVRTELINILTCTYKIGIIKVNMKRLQIGGISINTQEINQLKTSIKEKNISLGIEFGSTRIKAVLIDENFQPVVSGSYDWENQLINGYWTYSLEEIWKGLQTCYADLNEEVRALTGEPLKVIKSIGFSAMMHGYLPFDKENHLLVPFRTWRNTTTEEAEKALTEAFQYNIPQRWSIAHLYQAILNEEEHVPEIDYFTTLAGYIHWQLTGEKVLGLGDASGMFPIDSKTKNYSEPMIEKFDRLIKEKNYSWKLSQILPKALNAGETAGKLSKEGAKLLDPTGNLQEGIPLCPPEGDAGTGMVATNSVEERTGNVSAGTSVFAMVVLEKALQKVHPEIDMVTTPNGHDVAMVHANNCSSDINKWVKLFAEFSQVAGFEIDNNRLYEILFQQALLGDPDAGGLLSYGYYSGENITGFEEGRPLFVHSPNSQFNLPNFMRTHLLSSLGALKIGMNILVDEEKVKVEKIVGHGGFFKTPEVGQKIMAAAMNSTVSVMETAGEGGAWGMALLASYLGSDKDLPVFLEQEVFKNAKPVDQAPTKEDLEGFQQFIERYQAGLAIEQAAVSNLK